MQTIKIKKPKKVLVGADFSQLEVKTAVYASQDPDMKKAYEEGKDLYSLVGSMAYGVPYNDCLEFYPEGTILNIDGKEIVCGKKEYTNKEGKARRQASKSILIGSIYQRGVASIAEQIGKTKEETETIMNNFYKGFPTMTKWFEESKQFTIEHGYMDNAVGRRRRLPNAQLPRYSVNFKENYNTVINDTDMSHFNPFLECASLNTTLIDKYKKLLSNIKYKKEYDKLKEDALKEGIEIHDNNGYIQQCLRQCVNFQAQSLGADIVKLAMLEIDNNQELKELGFTLLLQIHDELVGEVVEENAEKVSEILSNIMINTAKKIGIDVPMSADSYIVSNWYEDELETSLLDNIMKHGDMDKEELFKLLCEEHTELTPESIHRVLFEKEKLHI